MTSKDLMVAAEEMGHKGVRAMTPLAQELANELRVKLGKGRELPEEPAKAKRVAKPKTAATGQDGEAVIVRKPARAKKTTDETAEDASADARPAAATIVKPKPVELATEPPVVAKPAAEIAPEPPRIAPVPPAPVAPPASSPMEPMKPAAAAPAPPPAPVAPGVRKPEPKIVPFRPLERSTPPPPPPSRPSRHPSGPFSQPRITQGPPRPAAPPPPPRPMQPAVPPAAAAASGPSAPARPSAPPEVIRPAAAAVIEPPPPPPPPVEVKRELVRVPESVTVAELAEKMRRKSGEVIKALIELGVMKMVNDLLDPTEAKLVADKFHFDLEIRSVEGDVIEEEEAGDTAQLHAAAAGGHGHGPRRPRQDVAARRHPPDEGGREGVRWHHPAHRGLPGRDQSRQGDLPRHAGPRGVHGHAGARRAGHRHRHPGGGGRRRRDAADRGGHQPRAGRQRADHRGRQQDRQARGGARSRQARAVQSRAGAGRLGRPDDLRADLRQEGHRDRSAPRDDGAAGGGSRAQGQPQPRGQGRHHRGPSRSRTRSGGHRAHPERARCTRAMRSSSARIPVASAHSSTPAAGR